MLLAKCWHSLDCHRKGVTSYCNMTAIWLAMEKEANRQMRQEYENPLRRMVKALCSD